MSALVVVAKSAVVIVACLVLADIVGVIACTVFDILPLRFASTAVAYAIWLVVGVYCGIAAYNAAGSWTIPAVAGQDWSAAPAARGAGTLIVVTAAVILAALAGLFHRLYWSQGVAGDDYVPDSAPHSLVFIAAILGAMLYARFWAMPAVAGR
jgi:hypothetical protein